MALHPTPALSFGDRPHYEHIDGRKLSPMHVVDWLVEGKFVHVSNQETAELVLAELGMSADEIQQRMSIAWGVRMSRWRSAG